MQTLGARFAHGLVSLEEAAELGCRACASPGGGCQFLGTAATAQVVAEAFGLTVPHAALAPSGQPIWLDVARRTAQAVHEQWSEGRTLADVLTPGALENAMIAHAAFGGSTNLLIHIPAIAHAAGLERPTVDDWRRVNRSVPRLVDALPNGPAHHPTIRVFMAGGVPEVMLHLRRLGLLDTGARTVTGQTWDDLLDEWEDSERRRRLRDRLHELDGVDPDDVICPPKRAHAKGMTSTVCFPEGNLAPGGSVVKSTSIDRRSLDEDGVFRMTGRARVFTRERDVDRQPQAARRRAGGGGRRDRPRRPRPARLRHGGDVPGDLDPPVPPGRPRDRAGHGRPLLRRLDRRMHRPREPGGARRRADRQGRSTAT